MPLSMFLILGIIQALRDLSINEAARVYSVLLSFAVYFMVVPLGAFCVEDRVKGIKAQQILMGVQRPTYWLGLGASDYGVGISIVSLGLIILAIVSSPILWEGSEYAACTFLILYLATATMAWFTYALSFMFLNKALCTAVNMWTGVILGLLMGLVVSALERSGLDTRRNAGDILRWVMRIFVPHFCVFDSLEYLAGAAFLHQSRQSTSAIAIGSASVIDGMQYVSDPWSMHASGASILFLALHLLMWLLVCIYKEKVAMSKQWARQAGKAVAWDSDIEEGRMTEDPDVKEERRRAADMCTHSALALNEVAKIYPGQSVPAVRNVSFVVSRGECFGLLGINGAGKTTTQSMISATVMPSKGSVFLAGEEIYSKPDLLAKHLGYCPQFDALWDHLTPREHLVCAARCRGYGEDDIPELVHQLLELVGLQFHATKFAKTLSGGNKRKLSLAMAVMGEPTVILLDEPSAGMDPVARQQMWNVVTAAAEKCAIVLTSHSMEEVEAICSRISIMVAGRIQAIGTSSHLKTRFSVGYKLDVLCAQPTAGELATFAGVSGIELVGEVRGPVQLAEALAGVKDAVREEITSGALGQLIHASMVDGIGAARNQAEQQGVSALELASLACSVLWRQDIIDFVMGAFQGASLTETQGARLTFTLPETGLSLADMFEVLERSSKEMHIEAFTLGQTTLEQVFNRFAAEGARDMEELISRDRGFSEGGVMADERETESLLLV
ncbi:unnamed protein product [Chrysoparadoxa australica]